MNIKDKYESHHNVTYSDEAIKACVHLTDRYISDRHLPDKAIDALDEAGSRVHITNIRVPKGIIEVEKKIEEIKEEKNRVVRSQRYEEAAKLRDTERQLIEEFDTEKKKWEQETKNYREPVTEDNVAEVVAMMTGVPTQRIAQNEGSRLVNMDTELRGSVVGQDNAIEKVVKSIRRNRAGLIEYGMIGPCGLGPILLEVAVAGTLKPKIRRCYFFGSTSQQYWKTPQRQPQPSP